MSKIKKIKIFLLIFSIIAVSLLAIYFRPIKTVDINLEISVEAEQDDNIQLFYVNNLGEDFTEVLKKLGITKDTVLEYPLQKNKIIEENFQMISSWL